MELKPVNKIDSDANTIRVSDGNSPIRLIFKDVKGEVINLYDKIDYFYLTKDNDKFYSVTDISYDGDEVIIRLPKLKKGQYKAEIRDKDGSIYPANEDLYILLRRSFEDDKDIHYFGHREDILNSVEPMVIQHINKNPNKFKGERGQQGFPGRDGLPGINGKDGKDGKDGDQGIQGMKGDKGDKGDKGEQGIQGIKGNKGDKGDKGVKGDPGIDGKDFDKNSFLVDQTMISDELKQQIAGTAEINAVPADGSITTVKIADKSVSQKKMNLPFGYLPLELYYTELNANRTRAYSEKISLPEDTIVYIHNSNYKISARYYDSEDQLTVSQWYEKEMRVSLSDNNSVSLDLFVGKVNDSAMSISEINNLKNIIEIVTPETSVKHSQLNDKLQTINEGDPYSYVLEHGSINGNTGANANTVNTRVRPTEMLNVPGNSVIELTDPDNYVMALYVDSINFFADGWNTTRYNVTKNDSLRWMVERKDKTPLTLVDMSKSVKVITPKTLLRKEDLSGNESGTGSTIVSNEADFFSAIEPNAVIDIANSFKITKKVTINVNLKINGNGHTIDGEGVTGVLITVSDGLVIFDNLGVTNGDTNIIRTTGGEVNIVDSKMLHSNDSVAYLGGSSVVKLIRSEFAYSKGNDGIAPKDSAKVYIYDCSAHDNFDEGISTHDSSYTEVFGGNYYNNGYIVGTAETTKTTGASSSFGGIHIGGGLMGIVKNANAYNNRTYGISLINFMDMTLDDKEIVTGNTVHDNGDFGIFSTASRDLMMSDNIIIRNGKGIGFGKEPGYATEIASKGYVTNNTIIDNIGVAVQVENEQADQYDVLFAGNTIVENGDNNIIVPSNYGGRVIQ